MDTRAIGTGAIIAGVSGVLLFISLFLKWFGEVSAWEGFDLVDIWLALIAVVAIVYAASGLTGARVAALSGPVVAAAGAMALVIVLVFVFEGEDRKFGLFLSLLSSAGIVFGGVTAGQEPTRGGPGRSVGTGASTGASAPPPPPQAPPPGGTPPPTA